MDGGKFDACIEKAKAGAPPLTSEAYAKLAERGVLEKPLAFWSFTPQLFGDVMSKYMAAPRHHDSR